MNRKPNFLVVGAAKAGTSWVHQCLQEHPDVYVPDRKEIRYFSVNYGKGKEWYNKFFGGCDEETAVGEVSPSYMVHDKAHKRIHKYNPKAKIIFILRDPIERAYSHYCMNVRAGEATKDINNEIKRGSRIVEDGMYLDAIEKYLEFNENKKNYLTDIYRDQIKGVSEYTNRNLEKEWLEERDD